MEPASIAGLAMSVYGTLNTSVGIIEQLILRFKNKKKLRPLCEQLKELVENMRKKLEQYGGQESPADLPQELVVYLEENKKDFGEVDGALKRLKEKVGTSPSLLDKGREFVKVNQWTKELEDLLRCVNRLSSTLLQLSIFKEVRREIGDSSRAMTGGFQDMKQALGRGFDEVTGGIEGLNAGMGRTKEEIVGELKTVNQTIATLAGKESEDQGPKHDEFSPYSYVPQNPNGVEIRLDDLRTMEGQLKEKLLDEEPGAVAAVSGPRGDKSTVAVEGMGGVGKSCALRAIGRDDEVKRRFKDGIYWMVLGKDATDLTFVQLVAGAVKDTGGVQRSVEIREMTQVEKAGEAAAKWFAGRCVLFLCDDLWSREGRRHGYFNELKSLADESCGARMLCSTRDRQIAGLAGKGRCVRFVTRELKEAKRIIRKYAEFDDDDVQGWDQGVREAFEFVTRQCGGLPLTLSIAGRTVAQLAKDVESSRAEAWNHYKERLENVRSRCRQLINQEGDEHTGLNSALVTSLEVAEQQIRKVTGRGEISAKKLFRALCVLRKQQWAPIFVLTNLWDVQDEHEAGDLIFQFESLSLVEKVIRDFGMKKKEMRLKLHDLVHDFCLVEATKEKEVETWHRKVLGGYELWVQEGGGYEGQESDSETPWYFKVPNDGYVHENLARHLVGSGSKEILDLRGLLLDFRWTARQLEVNGLLALENDFELLVKNLSPKPPSADRALKMIAGAVRLSLSGNIQSG